jgi:hypothetical protein
MNEDVNTFTAEGPKLVMSAAVSAALFYLESQKRSAKEKHQDYLNEDINTLKTNPSWDASKIQEELTKRHRPKTTVMGFGSSSYFEVTIKGLYQLLTDINNVIGLAAVAIEEKPSVPVVVHNSVPGGIPSYAATNTNTLFQPQTNVQKINIDELRKDLTAYKAKRESEWSYHYNFLGIEALIYFISDCILGTDYFNAKSRSVKIEAASKLVDHLDKKNHEPFTTHEKNALGEGRLGKIISTYTNNLDSLVAPYGALSSSLVAS